MQSVLGLVGPDVQNGNLRDLPRSLRNARLAQMPVPDGWGSAMEGSTRRIHLSDLDCWACGSSELRPTAHFSASPRLESKRGPPVKDLTRVPSP
jgi:hypothetical protein